MTDKQIVERTPFIVRSKNGNTLELREVQEVHLHGEDGFTRRTAGKTRYPTSDGRVANKTGEVTFVIDGVEYRS